MILRPILSSKRSRRLKSYPKAFLVLIEEAKGRKWVVVGKYWSGCWQLNRILSFFPFPYTEGKYLLISSSVSSWVVLIELESVFILVTMIGGYFSRRNFTLEWNFLRSPFSLCCLIFLRKDR